MMSQTVKSRPHVNTATVTDRSRTRDHRIDWLRGIALVSIFINHMPGNRFENWTTRNFGFSDAAELFVLLAGIAAALAFFPRMQRGDHAGVAFKAVRRACVLYGAHIFSTIAAVSVFVAAAWLLENDAILELIGVSPILVDPLSGLVSVLMGGHQLGYFNILPLYVFLILLVPGLLWLAARDVRLMLAASLAMYLSAHLLPVDMPNFPTDGGWFFNPFAWQLVFFTGFALMSGWLPAPPIRRSLIWLAAVVLLLSVPFAWYKAIDALPFVQVWRRDWLVLIDKSGFGILRYVHFLALAYLAWVAVGPGGRRLTGGPVVTRAVRVISGVGQQSLAVFATSMVLARVLGAVLYLGGSGPLVTLAVNLVGLATVIGVAALMRVIKRQPWTTARSPGVAPRVAEAVPEGVRT